VTHLTTKDCSCELNLYTGQERPEACAHGNRFLTVAQLNPKPRKPLRRVSEKREGEVRRRGSTLKRGRGFAVHARQRNKIAGLPCVNCGADGYETQIDPAHVWSRSYTPCDCEDGVVPLCRECHRLLDDPNQTLDLLPKLIDRGFRAEIVHAFVVHEIPLTEILKRLTGQEWKPVEQEGVVG